MCHFINSEQEHCLLLCDVKNHSIREINLHSKTVTTICGKVGKRGYDYTGGLIDMKDQELASPWDIVSTE
jgi:hypothetical protein